jgi:hypothetical protein
LRDIEKRVSLSELESSIYAIWNIERAKGGVSIVTAEKFVCNVEVVVNEPKSVQIYMERRDHFQDLCRQIKSGLQMLEGCEGEHYLEYDSLLGKYSLLSYYTGSYSDYLLLQRKYAGWACDAGTDWKTLRERLVGYESFALRNPNLPETTQVVQQEINTMFHFFLTGMDNTRILDTHTNNISEDLVDNYRKYLRESESMDRKKIVAELLASYEKGHYKITDDSREIVKKATGLEPSEYK